MRIAAPALIVVILLAGCGTRDEQHIDAVLLRAEYAGAFDAANVSEAARSLGWNATPGRAPGGLDGIAIDAAGLILHAARGHASGAPWANGWRIESHFPLSERVEGCSTPAAQLGAPFRPRFLSALDALERSGGYTRANVTHDAACTITIYD